MGWLSFLFSPIARREEGKDSLVSFFFPFIGVVHLPELV